MKGPSMPVGLRTRPHRILRDLYNIRVSSESVQQVTELNDPSDLGLDQTRFGESERCIYVYELYNNICERRNRFDPTGSKMAVRPI